MGQKFLPQTPLQTNAQGILVSQPTSQSASKAIGQTDIQPVSLPISQTVSQSKVERNYKLFGQLLKRCERHVNKNYDVSGLCRSFPQRVDDLIEAGGDRLNH